MCEHGCEDVGTLPPFFVQVYYMTFHNSCAETSRDMNPLASHHCLFEKTPLACRLFALLGFFAFFYFTAGFAALFGFVQEFEVILKTSMWIFMLCRWFNFVFKTDLLMICLPAVANMFYDLVGRCCMIIVKAI